jgi:hypothetical protein
MKVEGIVDDETVDFAMKVRIIPDKLLIGIARQENAAIQVALDR